MASIKQVYRSAYMNALDVPKAGGLDFTIKRAVLTPMKGKDGATVKKVVLYPTDPDLRAFALNKTNAEAVALIAGTEEYTEWAGTDLHIVRRLVDSFGTKAWAPRVDVPAELMPDEDESAVPVEPTDEPVKTDEDEIPF